MGQIIREFSIRIVVDRSHLNQTPTPLPAILVVTTNINLNPPQPAKPLNPSLNPLPTQWGQTTKPKRKRLLKRGRILLQKVLLRKISRI